MERTRQRPQTNVRGGEKGEEEKERKKKRGLIKSAAQTAVAAESGELPNLVLYPPKY